VCEKVKKLRSKNKDFDLAVKSIRQDIIEALDDPIQKAKYEKKADDSSHQSLHANRLQRLLRNDKHKKLVLLAFDGELVRPNTVTVHS
jgi:hypothetical protein